MQYIKLVSYDHHLYTDIIRVAYFEEKLNELLNKNYAIYKLQTDFIQFCTYLMLEAIIERNGTNLQYHKLYFLNVRLRILQISRYEYQSELISLA